MDRPSRAAVDEALQDATAKLLGLESTRVMLRVLAAEVRALREENETLREGLDEALKPTMVSDDELRNWLETLKSWSNDPEIVRLQRGLLDILHRTALQSDEVIALVKAARELHASEDFSSYECTHPPELFVALARALKPFEEPHG